MILYYLRTKTYQGLFDVQLALSTYMQEMMGFSDRAKLNLVITYQYGHVTSCAYSKRLIKWTCRSDIKSSLAREDVALYARKYKRTFLVSMNKMLCQSCTVSSVDVPCVSDVIFRFNVFLIDNILPLQQRLLSEYRCLRVCLKRNVMERLICQISVLNLVF